MSIARSIIARDDTLLGVCFAIGQDFGFNPTYLRLCFAALLFWSTLAAVGAYMALGVVVAITRWIAPEPVPAAEEEAEPAEEFEYELPLAA
jgi:phage shock protein PspC (stress-responsive transcriptional regulator)